MVILYKSLLKAFQFHIVRLKEYESGSYFAVNNLFQFHIVRLKGRGRGVVGIGRQFQFHIVRLKVG